MHRFIKRGVTRAETIASTGAITVLLLLAGAAVRMGDQKQMRTHCLANLRVIGAAMQQYGTEDARNLLVPIHARLQANVTISEFKFILPWMWGGVSGVTPWPFTSTQSPILTESDPLGRTWAGSTRPLSRYLIQDSQYQLSQNDDSLGPDAELVDAEPIHEFFLRGGSFECPADTGYPSDGPDYSIEAAPAAARNIPLIEALGNSYRVPLRCYVLAPTGRWFSASAMGHRADELQVHDRQALLGDALFFSMPFPDFQGGGVVLPFSGWHGEVGRDNLLFADGAARNTAVEPPVWFAFEDEPPLDTVPFDQRHLLARGSTYKLDCYPVPGTAFSPTPAVGWVSGLGDATRWPFANCGVLVRGQ